MEYGLKLAHSLGVPTILNPAPGCKLPDSIFQYCDYMTPNESEAEVLTGIRVASLEDAELAADALLARGVRNAVITLGAQGALVKNATYGSMFRPLTRAQWWRPPVPATHSTAASPWLWPRTRISCRRRGSAAPWLASRSLAPAQLPRCPSARKSMIC